MQRELLRNVSNRHKQTPIHQDGRSRSPIGGILIGSLLCVCIVLPGCSRGFWRKQADVDTYNIINERITDPRWQLPRMDIQPDPRSRFYYPYDPDVGPLPPDDPHAHAYMHWADGKGGYKSWHKLGQEFSVENPHWLAPFGLSPELLAQARNSKTKGSPTEGDNASVVLAKAEFPDLDESPPTLQAPPPAPLPEWADDEERHDAERDSGGYDVRRGDDGSLIVESTTMPGIEQMTLDQALELANIHSREYQTAIEQLYLTALDLTFDRFQFDVRYLGIGGGRPSADFTYEALPRRDDGGTFNPRFGVSQLLPTGGQWAVELANNTLWLFTGPNQTSSASVLSYSLVQPLMFGAGRKIVMEGLTQGEREVLYSTRNLARFRKIFFTDVVSPGGQGGFLGLLAQRQTVINERDNVARLEQQVQMQRVLVARRTGETTQPLDMLPEGVEFPEELIGLIRYDADRRQLIWMGDMTREHEELLLQLSNDPAYQEAVREMAEAIRREIINNSVAQLLSRLLASRNSLRNAERAFQDSLDNYKIQLGLPPNMPISIDESLLRPFQLIDPQLPALGDRIEAFVEDVAEVDEDDPGLDELRRLAAGLAQLEEQFEAIALASVDADFAQLQTVIEAEGDFTADPERPRRRFATEVDWRRTVTDVENDRRLYERVRGDVALFQQRLQELRAELENDLTLEQRIAAHESISLLREELLRYTQGLQVIQTGLRVELITLELFTMSMEEAVDTALENRLDLMNARARVMDARRRVEVAANRLEAVLNVVAEGDIGTDPGANPFTFRKDRSSFRAGVAFTAPLDQIAERNNYRAALVAYQRARRDYMFIEDQIKNQIRQHWRQLSVLRENFENNRQRVRFAALQYDIAVEEAAAPAPPGQPVREGGGAFNLLDALSTILGAQNDLIRDWVFYETNRLNIYRDMDIMEIDPQGVWIDDFYQTLSRNIEPADEIDEPRTNAFHRALGHTDERLPVGKQALRASEDRRDRDAIDGEQAARTRPIEAPAGRGRVVHAAGHRHAGRDAEAAGSFYLRAEGVSAVRDRSRQEWDVPHHRQ
jgi:hypothetical protein